MINELRPIDSAGTVQANVRAPANRWVQLVSDDVEQALGWSLALAAEGIGQRTCAWDSPAAEPDDEGRPDAWIVHLSRALPPQLVRVRNLRARTANEPMLLVCAALRDLDQVLALEMGADDVVDAGLPATVVAARLRALWRRCTTEREAPARAVERLHFGELSLHLRDRRTLLHNQPVPLTEGEFEVLWLLALRAGHAVSRLELVRKIRGLDYQRLDRSIDCRVYRIRSKLGDHDPARQRIRTVRNRGYLFAPSPW